MTTGIRGPARLVEVIGRLSGPLIGARDHSLVVRVDDDVTWIARAPGCPHGADVPLGADGPEGEGWRHLRVSGGGATANLWLHGPAHAGLTAILCMTGQVADLELDRDDLCEELTVSHESLASLYELSADPARLLEPDLTLQEIVDRAMTFEPGLRAVLWLVDGERLVPMKWRGPAPAPRPRTGGIVGKVLERERAVIVNGWSHQDPSAPELAPARRVAVAPLLLKGGPIGAFQVWTDRDGSFDSRYMGLLRTLCALAAMTVDHDRLRRDLVETARLRQEVDIAATIQENLLIGRVPDPPDGLEMAAISVPSRQVDGDFVEFFSHAGGVTDVVLGDVMGKGLPAAMMGAAIKSHFVRYAATDAVSSREAGMSPPGEVVSRVHRDVVDGMLEVDTFATAVYARFHARDGSVDVVDCGHVPILHFRQRTGDVVRLRCEWPGLVNLPLGMHADASYESVSVRFEPGDVFLICSDGLTEATAPDGEMLGLDALAAVLRGGAPLDAGELLDRLQALVTDFTGGRGLRDDLTCVAVRVPDGPVLWRLELPAVMSSLGSFRRFVADRCRPLSIADGDDQAVFDLQVAVVEVVSNVIRHGWPDGGRGKVSVEIRPGPARVEVEVRDGGRPFDPRTAPEPALTHEAAGGLGIHIVRSVTDALHYERSRGENVLTLVKHMGAR